MPIHYVALYQTNKLFGENNGQIEYYGEAIRVALVKRSSIEEVPMGRNNGDELYYRITVREWKKISETNETGLPIKPKESGFVVEDSRFVFADGEIIAIKDGKVVDKKSILDFNRRPAQVFRMLQNSIEMGK